MKQTKRIFIGIKIPLIPEIKSTMEDLRGRLDWCSARWSDSSFLHLTLAFLGEITLPEIDRVRLYLVELVANRMPFEVRISSLGCFSKGAVPVVIWLGVEPSADLMSIHKEINLFLVKRGLIKGNERYKPHITLARIKSCVDTLKTVREIHLTPVPLTSEFLVSEITLFESHLTSKGAKYTELERFQLNTLLL